MSHTCLLRICSNRVVCGDSSGSLLSWRLRQRGGKARFEGIYLGHASAILACQFDDQIIVSSCTEDVRIWDVKSGVCLGILPFQFCETIQISDSFIGAGSIYGDIFLCTRSGRSLCKTVSQYSSIQSLQIHEPSGTLASLSSSGRLMVQEIHGNGKFWEEQLPRNAGICQLEVSTHQGSPVVHVKPKNGLSMVFGLLDGRADESRVWIE